MCGIAGFWDPKGSIRSGDRDAMLARMLHKIVHRGPDDAGTFFDDSSGLSLGHRRLSIVDLSPLGHQPMVSSSGRYVIIYNGEVYNFRELRRELEQLGATFKGSSDTEVMLAAIERWGLERSLEQFNGMFAFALYDRDERKIYLVRDRLGIKPVYYGLVGGVFAFASELKPIRAMPGFANRISRDALALFMRHNYVPAPYSIFEGIRKLRPGMILDIDAKFLMEGNGRPDWVMREKRFWCAKKIIEEGVSTPRTGDDFSYIQTLHDKLRRAIGFRMIADVPLGAFLSGGIDSSTVVALMQSQATMPVKTFSIGFREDGYDEAVYARKVAAHLATDHTELYVSPQEAMQVIPKLPSMYDEPFSDSSQIPTYLVSALARTQVTVGLSGDGGDELFGGYTRYLWGDRLWNRFKRFPWAPRSAISKLLRDSPAAWGGGIDLVSKVLPHSWRVKNPAQKVTRLSELLKHRSLADLYLDLVSHWPDPTAVVIGSTESPTAVSDRAVAPAVRNNVEAMMATDLVSYLPDDILTKVDRASMAVSLEARVPLLDFNVVEYAWRIPFDLKHRNGSNKWILKEVLRRYVPDELIERPKMGFGVPIGSWIRNELGDWADDLLSESTLRRQGYFKPEPIIELWQNHRRNAADHQYQLWDVLMFQAWLAELEAPAAAEGYSGASDSLRLA